MDKRDPIIVSAVRTAIGDFGGAFRDVQHTDLASHVMREVCGRVDNFPKEEVGDVYWGVVMVRSDENGLARCAMLQAGLPVSSSAVQMNRACCSSMEAIRVACMSIRQGESDAIVAGGGESMSNVPYSIKGARWGLKMRHQVLSDGVWDGLSDQYTGLIMGLTAENVAEEYGISRKEQDEFAYRSQINAKKALETGRFKDEIAPFVIQGKHGKPDKIIDTDEHPRPNTTLEGLSKLPPAFKENGTVTAGNSSGINDGASAVLIVSRELADRLRSDKAVEGSRGGGGRRRAAHYGHRSHPCREKAHEAHRLLGRRHAACRNERGVCGAVYCVGARAWHKDRNPQCQRRRYRPGSPHREYGMPACCHSDTRAGETGSGKRLGHALRRERARHGGHNRERLARANISRGVEIGLRDILSAFQVTVRLLPAMAATAMRGLRRPAAATGIAKAL